MFDFEVKIRKTMTDFLSPSIERMAKTSEGQVKLIKDSESMLKRLAELEEAVYNQGKANPIFDDIKDRITKGEVRRKLDNEELRNRMDNVEEIVSQ